METSIALGNTVPRYVVSRGRWEHNEDIAEGELAGQAHYWYLAPTAATSCGQANWFVFGDGEKATSVGARQMAHRWAGIAVAELLSRYLTIVDSPEVLAVLQGQPELVEPLIQAVRYSSYFFPSCRLSLYQFRDPDEDACHLSVRISTDMEADSATDAYAGLLEALLQTDFAERGSGISIELDFVDAI